MQNKYFISHLDTPLGHHLSELFRTDHLDTKNHSIIIGTAQSEVHPSAYKTFDFSKYPQVVCRAVLDCDVVVLDLRSPSHEPETIIRFLSQAASQLSKTITVIGISTLMTWEGSQSFQVQKDGPEKQKIIASIVTETEWKRRIWQDSHYKRRIPNNFYIKTYELQNLLLLLNKNKYIKASVLSSGIIYGRQNSELSSDILNALSNQQLCSFGQGQNLLSLTHIQTLLQGINQIIDKNSTGYLIIKDKSDYTQRQLKEIINRNKMISYIATFNTKGINNKELLFLTKEESNWTINLQFKSSPLFETINFSNFQTYAQRSLINQFCSYNVYNAKHLLVIQEYFDPEIVNKIGQQFKETFLIISQGDLDKLNQELVLKNSPTEPEVTNKKQPKLAIEQKPKEPIHYYKECLQILLPQKRYNNWIVICNKQIGQIINNQHDYGHLSEMIPVDYQLNANRRQFHYESTGYYEYFQLERSKTSRKDNDETENLQKMCQNVYVAQKSIKKDEQLIALNQYLLDNVLTYVAEAKFRLKMNKKELNLSHLIEELKQIWVESSWDYKLSDKTNIPTKSTLNKPVQSSKTIKTLLPP